MKLVEPPVFEIYAFLHVILLIVKATMTTKRQF